jgi:hypothetical protein
VPTGVTVTNETASSSTWTSAPLTLGGYTWDGFSKTRISALRIYDRVLSGSEISQNFEADKGRAFRTPVPALSPPPPVIQFDAGLTDSHRGYGTTWKDRATTGLVGTLSGGAYFSAFAGGTVVLDGTNDWVSVPGTFSLPGDYSITTWFKPAAISASSTDLVALHAPDGVNFGTLLELVNGKVRFLHWSPLIASGGPSNLSTSTLDARRFHEVTLVRTGAKLSLYVDGLLSDEVTASTSNYTSPLQLTIGRISSTIAERHFQGHIANVQVHDRALTAAEVAANHAAIRPRFDTILDYDLGSPNFLVNSRYFDLSNHALHGAATGISFDTTAQAQAFDSADAISAGNPASLAELGDQLTVECWFMTNYNSPSTNDWPFLVSKRYSYGANNASFELFLDNQVAGRRLYFGVKTANMNGGAYVVSPSGTAVTDGKWHHVLGTYDGTAVRLYLDGVYVGSSSVTGPILRLDHELLIGTAMLAGARNAFYQWYGYMSRVRIYKRALTADEVASRFQEFRARHPVTP